MTVALLLSTLRIGYGYRLALDPSFALWIVASCNVRGIVSIVGFKQIGICKSE